ncbi:MAG: TldD/PmbA family protein [Nitrospinae bacterium]|nr:TldD/PmbA family protein [Nitrospinota bacterium]
MIDIAELRRFVADGLEAIRSEVVDAEIFAAWNEQLIARLNYTSDIPCNGVQEPKSSAAYGVGVLATFREGDELRLGFGSEPGDLSLTGVRLALEKARRNAVHDPDFHSFPSPSAERPTLEHYHDPKVMELTDETLVDLGWEALEGALLTFRTAGQMTSLIVNGDVTVQKEQMAIKSTRGIDAWDETTILMATITTMIEKEHVKGTGWSTGTSLSNFSAREAGREAARSALNTMGGRRITSGEYTVVFGPQAVTELCDNLIIPALSLDSIDAASSPYVEKLGLRIMSPLLHIYDDGAIPGAMASKRVTCEGLPTGRTDLVERGLLVGFLADDYTAKKLGTNVRTFMPRNGFRFGGGGRNFRQRADIFATNLVLQGAEEVSHDALLARVGTGLYIGRIWYTYPINGLGPGDFTSTIVGDSYLIEAGSLGQPLKPNTVRINDNFIHLFQRIIGITREKKSTLVWAAEETVVAPELAVQGVHVENIAEYMG